MGFTGGMCCERERIKEDSRFETKQLGNWDENHSRRPRFGRNEASERLRGKSRGDIREGLSQVVSIWHQKRERSRRYELEG